MEKQSKRTTVLMAILIVVLGIYLVRPYVSGSLARVFHPEVTFMPPVKVEPPLAGENQIIDVRIEKVDEGTYRAKVKYFFRGEPTSAKLYAEAYETVPSEHFGYRLAATRGEHEVEIDILRPYASDGPVTSRRVQVTLGATNTKLKVTKEIAYPIEWPGLRAYQRMQAAKNIPIEVMYAEAVRSIDSGSHTEIDDAKTMLEQIVIRDPKYVPAYIELARVAMKSNWGGDGLAQAERFLLTAQELDAQSANAKVLMGYVYAHQKRFKESEAQFTAADKLGTKNLWLWANWGELHLMQREETRALDKYLKAVDGARSFDTYDRARLDAYRNLFTLLERTKQYDRMEQLYVKRSEEFANQPCFLADYGDFRLRQFGDFKTAIERSTKALTSGCSSEEAKQSLGIAYYFSWAAQTGAEKSAAIAQARVFFPEGPELLYELAQDEKSSSLISPLLKTGVSLRALNDDKLNALGMALTEEDIAAARRLLKVGAKFDDPVGPHGVPVAFLPFMMESVPGVRLVIDSGVDLRKMSFNGSTLVQFARTLKNPEISDLVNKNKRNSDTEL